MRIASSLAVAAALFVAAPVMAQTPPPAADAPAPARAPASPEEAALNAKAEAFSARMEQAGHQLEAALTAAGGDAAKATADTDAILNGIRPEVETFATEVETFLNGESAKATDAEEKTGLAQAAAQAGAAIRAIPDQVRAGIQERLANPASATAPAGPPAQ